MKGTLPRRTLVLWQIRLALTSFFPIILFYNLASVSDWFLTGAIAFLVLSIFSVFWYLPKYFESYEILFPNGGIVIKRGVFIKVTHVMPFSRLIYAKSLASPFARMFGLSALAIKATRATLYIPELKAEDVTEFIEYLSREGEQ